MTPPLEGGLQRSCSNCGIDGHFRKECKKARVSCGIIAWRTSTNGEIEYLLIKRKDSCSFVDLKNGNFKITNKKYILRLLKNCRIDELEDLLTNKDYDKFKVGQLRKMESWFINNVNSIISQKKEKKMQLSLGWGFPKGRREIGENDAQCAIREFSEETGYDFHKDRFVMTSSVSGEHHLKVIEKFKGINGLRYEYRFFVAECKNIFLRNPIIDKKNPSQYLEVSDVSWMNWKEIISKLERYSSRKFIIDVHSHIEKQMARSKKCQKKEKRHSI